MKALIISIIFSCIASLSLNAQEVYNTIHTKAKETVENPNTASVLRDFNQFKVDALDYLLIKMREQMPDSTVSFLDKQALALNNFMNLYTSNILQLRNEPKVYMIEVVKIFMDASYSNPLFNDADKDLVMTYYSNGDSMTRFSLDTDWQRAYVAASFELKKWKENGKAVTK
ncbi:hypothetical protein L6475_05580 [Prevotella sp. E9-3]|uniref:hypothetical protein n=1 Tax=Prevotella sp. E9-3 TaxID=2913621 RepID=UPI001ED9D802|nr:hypothetical protein [Prevotella sp. E9-3]UKK49408.1 hypothetical protein L6475_05580 [Prevotella sp. E9-3]